MENSNQLLHFLTAATSNLQEALSKPCNGKKVNHRRYIQKRLQKRDTSSSSSKPTKKSSPTNNKSTTSTQRPLSSTVSNIRPHPVASSAPSILPQCWPLSLPPSLPPPSQPSLINGYHNYQQHLMTSSTTPPLSNSPSSSLNNGSSYSRPHSCPQPPFDPEVESILNEFGLDSPSPQFSEVSTTSVSDSLSRQPSLNTVHWDTYLPPNEFIPSPHSDFSDVDDSAYSSPCNPSPVYYPVRVCSPPTTSTSTSSSCYHHHVATGSCEWSTTSNYVMLPPTSGPAVPSFLNITPTLAVPTSLNEILELVTP